jgi:hypothetical protein
MSAHGNEPSQDSVQVCSHRLSVIVEVNFKYGKSVTITCEYCDLCEPVPISDDMSLIDYGESIFKSLTQ